MDSHIQEYPSSFVHTIDCNIHHDFGDVKVFLFKSVSLNWEKSIFKKMVEREAGHPKYNTGTVSHEQNLPVITII